MKNSGRFLFYFSIGLLACGLVVSSTPAFAQENVGGIRGVVVGPDGNPVVNAPVSLLHVPSGAKRTSTTNTAGAFVFGGQRVGGPYTLTVTDDNFEVYTQEKIHLTLGKYSSLKVRLRVRSVEEITILAGALPRRSSSQMAIGVEQMESLPAVGRDPKSYIRLVPEAVVDGDFDQVTIAGTNNRYNSVTVDGIRQDDDFGLNNNGYPTQRSPVSISAIEEVSVNLSPFDVRYGRFLGGNINMVTKSGTNEFRGSVFTAYTGDRFTGDVSDDNIYELDFNELTYGATLGGPIIKDKLHFFVAVDGLTSTSPNEIGPAGSGAANEIAGVSRADADEAIRISKEVYGFNAGGYNLNLKETDLKILAKLDYIINDRHRMTASYQRSSGNNINARGSSVNSNRLGLTSNWYNKTDTLNSFAVRVFSDWTPDLNTRLEFGGKIVDTRQVSLNGTDFMLANIDTADGGTILLGPDYYRQANRLDNDLFHVKLKANYLTVFAGLDHLLSSGLEYEQLNVFNLFVPGSRGDVDYNSLADYRNKKPTGMFYRNSVTNNANDAAAKWGTGIGTFYVQDELDITENFSAQAGVRGEVYTATGNITRNQKFVDRNMGFRKGQGLDNTSTLNGRVVMMPRFSATYHAAEGLNLRAGAGLYSGGTPNVWVSNSYTNNGVNIDGTFEGDDATLDGFDGRNIPESVQSQLKPGDGNVDVLDPNFRIPSSWKASTGLEYLANLPLLGSAKFDVNYIFTRVNYAPVWRDLRYESAEFDNNSPVGQFIDGRSYFDQANFDTRRGYDLMLTNTTKGQTHSLSFAVNKRTKLVDVYLAYAWQNSRDVATAGSSTSSSNYGRLASGQNPNYPGLSRSIYERTHRFLAVLTFTPEIVPDLESKLSFFWETRSGQPFSWTYGGRRDDLASLFGESRDFSRRNRQLFYVPNEDMEGVVLDGITREDFDAFLADTGLNKYRGKIAPANAFTGKWVHTLDMRISQELANFGDGRRLRLFFDMKNVTNFLNKTWGRYAQVGFPYMATAANVSVDENGNYVYSRLRDREENPETRVSTLGSLWKAQATLIYDF